MKTKILITTLVLIAYAVISEAQHRTFIGFESSVGGGINKITDNMNFSNASKNSTAGMYGFTLRQELNSTFSVETGFLNYYNNEWDYYGGFEKKEYDDMHNCVDTVSDGYSFSYDVNAKAIPLRLYTKLNLYKHKFFIVPVFGGSFCINQDKNSSYTYEYNGKHEIHYWGGDSTVTRYYDTTKAYTRSYDNVKNFLLLQAGLGIEFKLLKTFDIRLYGNYYAGFKNIFYQDDKYWISNSLKVDTKTTTNGSYWDVGLSIRYPLNNIVKDVKNIKATGINKSYSPFYKFGYGFRASTLGAGITLEHTIRGAFSIEAMCMFPLFNKNQGTLTYHVYDGLNHTEVKRKLKLSEYSAAVLFEGHVALSRNNNLQLYFGLGLQSGNYWLYDEERYQDDIGINGIVGIEYTLPKKLDFITFAADIKPVIKNFVNKSYDYWNDGSDGAVSVKFHF